MNKKLLKSVKHVGIACAAMFVSLGLASCSNDDLNEDDVAGIEVKSITSLVATMPDVTQTRAQISNPKESGTKHIVWSEGDCINVFSDIEADMKRYSLVSSDGTQATFRGKRVRSKEIYYAVYPGDNYWVLSGNILRRSLPDDLNSTDANDFRFDAPMLVVSDGSAFAFQQTVGMIHVSVGKIYNLHTVTLRGNNGEAIAGEGYINLADEEPVFTIDKEKPYSNAKEGSFNVDTEGESMDIFFILPPTVFEKGFTIDIKGKDENGKAIEVSKATSQKVEVKHANNINFTLVDIEEELKQHNDDDPIVFADENMKTIFIKYWDTDGDGELSYGEAAAVTDIDVFCGDTSITSLDELQYFTGVTSIGDYVFYECLNLTSIIIPEGVTSIGDHAFSECSSLASITIPEGVTSIGGFAFHYCSSLTSITIPEDVISIGDYAFADCSSLTSINIPEGVTSIGEFAFYGCRNLTSITIPKDVTSIGLFAFNECRSLTSITCLATTPPTLDVCALDDTNDCPIYVPAASVDDYKAEASWSAYVGRIQAIPE